MKVPSLRWVIAALLFAETMLAYLDMQELSVLAPVLREKLGITTAQYAGITQAFLIAYSIMFLLGGRVIDWLGVRWGLVAALLWWSVACMSHAYAASATGLAICRFALGVGYPGAFLAAARAISEWYPPQERAFVYGIYTTGATVGAVIAYPLVVWITIHWNWRAAFVITGLAGLVLTIVWALVYRSPERHPWITQQEAAYVLAGVVKESPISDSPRPWGAILRTRTFWAVAVGRFIGDSPWIFYALWLPKFLNEGHGLSLQEIGRVGWIPFLFADLGSVGGGWLSGRLVRNGFPAQRARTVLLTVSAAVLAFTFVLASIRSTPVLLCMLSLCTFFTTSWLVNLNVIIVDTFPSSVVATASGFTTSAGTLSTFGFTYAVGWLAQHHSYGPVFYVMSILSVLAYILVRIILPKSEREEHQGKPASA